MSAPDNVKTIQAVYEAFGRGDVLAILDVVADDVDWGTDTASPVAPWHGIRRSKAEVQQFFEALGAATEVDVFEPVAIAGTDDGDVMTFVRFTFRRRETGESASMNLHHYFHLQDGRIDRYRGTEDLLETQRLFAD